MKTFFNLTKSEWKEFGKDAALRLGIGIPAALIIALLGSSIHAAWLVIPVTPIITGGVGYLITKNDDKKTRMLAAGGYAFLGLIFGVLGYIAI